MLIHTMSAPADTKRHIGIHVTTNREALIAALGGREAGQKVRIEMPCGAAAEYATLDELPATSVACACGAEGCWLIYYADQKQ